MISVRTISIPLIRPSGRLHAPLVIPQPPFAGEDQPRRRQTNVSHPQKTCVQIVCIRQSPTLAHCGVTPGFEHRNACADEFAKAINPEPDGLPAPPLPLSRQSGWVGLFSRGAPGGRDHGHDLLMRPVHARARRLSYGSFPRTGWSSFLETGQPPQHHQGQQARLV